APQIRGKPVAVSGKFQWFSREISAEKAPNTECNRSGARTCQGARKGLQTLPEPPSTEASRDVVFGFLAGGLHEDLVGFAVFHEFAQIHVGRVVGAAGG